MTKRSGRRVLVLMAWTKAIISVLLAGVVGYSIVAGIPVDAKLLKVILALLAGYFGLSAKVYYSAGNGGRGSNGHG